MHRPAQLALLEGALMKTFLLTLAAVVAGVVVLLVLVIGVEMFSAVVHPFPAEFGGTPEEVCRHVERYPAWVLAVVVPMWGLAAFAATWTAGRIGNLWSAAVVGLLIVGSLALNISMLPYPLWFEIAILLAVPAAAIFATRVAQRRKATGDT